jgi:hypothetical protein
MDKVLEFPTKVFVQWGAIAQEIVPYLAQRGARREEICAVIDRVRIKWEQLELVQSGRARGVELSDQPEIADVSLSQEEGDRYVSRHWRSQSARTLIESAMTDYEHNSRP